MYKHILIATDGSDLAQKGVDQGLALGKALAAKVTAVTVTEPLAAMLVGEAAIALPIDDYDKAASADAAGILAGVTASAAKTGVPCDTLHVKDQYPAEGIVDAAGREDATSSSTSYGAAAFQAALGSQATNC
jgi:nucleotide-binding universal stress UspA family protein